MTIADVAAAAGVSRAAVSKVIRNAYGVSDAMHARVQKAIDELGYRPSVAARSMRGSSFTFGFEIPTLANPLFDLVIAGAMDELEGTPYQVIIAPTGSDPDHGTKSIEALSDRQVDGIVAVSAALAQTWLERLARNLPVVLVGRHDQSAVYDTIVNDDALGASLVVEHLHALGHKDILHLTVDPVTQGHQPRAPHAVRSEGYVDTMNRLGLAQYVRLEHITPDKRSALRRTLEIIDSPARPTAIFAGHDELAMGVLEALAVRGLTSEDISVVGYDDSDIAAHPLVSLTSVNQSARSIGTHAVRHLMGRIAGRRDPIHTVITPELRPRRSSTVASTATHG